MKKKKRFHWERNAPLFKKMKKVSSLSLSPRERRPVVKMFPPLRRYRRRRRHRHEPLDRYHVDVIDEAEDSLRTHARASREMGKRRCSENSTSEAAAAAGTVSAVEDSPSQSLLQYPSSSRRHRERENVEEKDEGVGRRRMGWGLM